MSDMEYELSRWKRIATYLADCHAATAEGVMHRKSSSMSERERQETICERAMHYLQGGDPGHHGRNVEPVIERLARIAGTDGGGA